jgi:hypothetical protein
VSNKPWKFRKFGRRRSDYNESDYERSEDSATDDRMRSWSRSRSRSRSTEPAAARSTLFSGGTTDHKHERHASFAGSAPSNYISQVAHRDNANANANATPAASSDAFGLTLVHDTDHPVADLIFVHGLGGSPMRTWSYNRDIQNFWLPWLGSEPGLSDSRIFTFGYNAHFAQQSTTLTILDFAKDLLFRLKTYCSASDDEMKLIGQVGKPLLLRLSYATANAANLEPNHLHCTLNGWPCRQKGFVALCGEYYNTLLTRRCYSGIYYRQI